MDIERLVQIAQGLQIGNIRRHIFLCCDQTKPKCAPKEVGIESWEYLKRRLAELGLLAGDHRSEERRVGKAGRSRWSPYHFAKKTRYLILPWVQVEHLASHLLGAMTRRLS